MQILELILLKLQLASSRPVHVRELCMPCGPICHHRLVAWPNARNISTQHLATLLHDVATCVEWTDQKHATYPTWVAKRTQHVVPKNVARCFVEMLRAFGQAFTIPLLTQSLTLTNPVTQCEVHYHKNYTM